MPVELPPSPEPNPPRPRQALIAGIVVVALAAGVLVPALGQESPDTPVAAPPDSAPVIEPGEVPDAAGLPSAPFSFADMVEEVLPAVVSIRVRSVRQSASNQQGGPLGPFNDQFGAPEGQPQYSYGEGSGFFISGDGYVVTNNHVVEDADRFAIVRIDGTVHDATVIGTDPRTDLALLKVDGGEFPFVGFAQEQARIGDWVIAVGNPFGLGGSVSSGIVSALGRDIGAGPYDDFIQMDTPINRGNSGGPSFNSTGEVVGVNTAIFSPQGGGSVGISFAIPAYVVQNVVAELQEKGVVERGWLGVNIQGVTSQLAAALDLPEVRGALVSGAEPGTPAANAGIAATDVILAVNGTPVEGPRDLSRTIASLDPGEDVALTVWRDGAEEAITVTLGRLPGEEPVVAQAAPPAEEATPDVPGLGLAVAPGSQVRGVGEGVVVVEVAPDGQGAAVGLQPGDVIVAVGDEPVETPEELGRLLTEAANAGDDAVLVLVRSGEAQGYVAFDVSGMAGRQ
ncbi:MAG: trypsin-like peptidase domain-containing protein [Bauldia sp.]|nr:trypsin-like peptidase domain-containing protein [Bauldia sp.]